VRENYCKLRDISLKTKSIGSSGMPNPKTLGLVTMPNLSNFGSGGHVSTSDFGLSR